VSSSEAGKLERLFASLWRRMLGEDQKPGEYYKPFPIFYEPPPSQQMNSKSWIRPRGPRRNHYY
jgi:hypothetical protein